MICCILNFICVCVHHKLEVNAVKSLLPFHVHKPILHQESKSNHNYLIQSFKGEQEVSRYLLIIGWGIYTPDILDTGSLTPAGHHNHTIHLLDLCRRCSVIGSSSLVTTGHQKHHSSAGQKIA